MNNNPIAKEARANARRALAASLFAMMSDVDTFQKEILDLPIAVGPLREHRFAFKVSHMREEIEELKAAYKYNLSLSARAFEYQVDAIVDLIYVAMGALLEMGVQPSDVFDTVHEANMRKMRGETKRGESYDAVKPEGWTPPDHEAILMKMELLAQVSPTFLEATAVVLKRGADYNGPAVRREDHFPFGMKSVFQMMWVKVMRMKADLDAGRPVNRDHLIDLINYSDFGVKLLDGKPL